MVTEGVKVFLKSLDLEQYYEMFVAKGFDQESDICHINSEDLDSMYIAEQGHRKRILDAVPQFTPSREFILYEWLREKGLDHYFISFVQSDLIDLNVISRLNLPDEELYDELEITLPGHKRRLERAVHQLAKKHRMSIPTFGQSEESGSVKQMPSASGKEDKMEIPVAYGRWGKPKCLLEAKYDFLILDATVASTLDPLDRVQIEFMVDSGSDVVTLRQEVLDSLDLELIGPIKSKGVHASKTKNLYRANMLIGNHSLEIEVMGESYDSIGSRVIRHFRHYISGNRHIWLKGDFVDPTIKSDETASAAGTSHQVTSKVPATVIAQDKLAEEMKMARTQELPVTSEEKEVGEPEDSEETTEEKMDSSAKFQKDSALIHGTVKREIKHASPTTIKIIEFSFKTAENIEANVEEKSDETDRLIVKEDDIIDVRPFIEANRAKYARASQCQAVEKFEDNKIRIDNSYFVNGIVESNFSCAVTQLNDSVQSELSYPGELVLSQRSVYYRSQKK